MEWTLQKLIRTLRAVEHTKAVRPNRRGVRSRETVLDAAERVMAARGYDGASLSAVVAEAGIPISSLYHYFGSKNGMLLAVMERGARRFFASLPEIAERQGSAEEHLTVVIGAVTAVLEEQPDFLRLLVALAAQPPADEEREVREVVNRVRAEATARLGEQMGLAFGLASRSRDVARLARFALATIDGAFVARQADPSVELADVLDGLPAALVAIAGR